MAEKKPCTAIVLAAGRGTRMGTSLQKQYLKIEGKPVLAYSLETFQESELIDDIILVVGEGHEEYCRQEILGKYNITKVKQIVEGGAERYHSVWSGLSQIWHDGYVFIHDGARPFVTEGILERAYGAVCKYDACVVGMPTKDTIKVVDAAQFAKETPNRAYLWMIQTPQVFAVEVVKEAYEKLMQQKDITVTDDAMVVEQMLGHSVKLVKGSYENIKITTPEDLGIAGVFAAHKKRG